MLSILCFTGKTIRYTVSVYGQGKITFTYQNFDTSFLVIVYDAMMVIAAELVAKGINR